MSVKCLQNLCAHFTLINHTKLLSLFIRTWVEFCSLSLLKLLAKLGNQFIVPCVGTGDLLLGLELAEGAVLVVGQITLGPLAETGGDLLDAADWVAFVVTAESGVNVQATVFGFTSLAVSWATVLVVLVIVSASLETLLETGNVTGELAGPVGGGLLSQVIVAPFTGEATQLVETLKWVTWWDLLVGGGGGGNEGKGESFHFW